MLAALFWALLGAQGLRLGLTVGRRLIAGKVSLAVEYDLRSASMSTCRSSSRLLRHPSRPAS